MLSEQGQKHKNRFFVVCAFIIASILFVEGDLSLKFGGSEFTIPEDYLSAVFYVIFIASFAPLFTALISGVANFNVSHLTKLARERIATATKSEENLVLDGAVRRLNDYIVNFDDDRIHDGFPMPFKDGSKKYKGIDIFAYKEEIADYSRNLTAYLDVNPDHNAKEYRQERRKWLLPLLRKHYSNLSDEQLENIVNAQIIHIENEYELNYPRLGAKISKAKRNLKYQTRLFKVLVALNDLILPVVAAIVTISLLTGILRIST